MRGKKRQDITREIKFRIVSYVVSFVAGGIFFYLAQEHPVNQHLAILFSGIAAGLFSVPIVFGLFKIMQEMTSSNVKKVLRDCAMFEINGIMLSLIMELKELLRDKSPMTSDNLQCFLALSQEEIIRKIIINEDIARMFEKTRMELVTAVHNMNALDTLSDKHIMDLMSLIIEIDTLVMAMRCRLTQKEIRKESIGKAVETILGDILNWIEKTGIGPILEHRYFEFLSEDEGAQG